MRREVFSRLDSQSRQRVDTAAEQIGPDIRPVLRDFLGTA